MKKISLAIIFICCSLALASQNGIRVTYKGAAPSITDFVSAYLSPTGNEDDEDYEIDEFTNSLRQTWEQYHKGKPLEEGEVLTIDKKNGYILLERKQEEYLTKIEMCYWNESDKKHKLFAVSVTSFVNGKYSVGQYDGLSFYRYNNASKTMSLTHDVGFDVALGTSDGAQISYSLPRTGKDIIATMWYENKTKKKTIRWKGRKFN